VLIAWTESRNELSLVRCGLSYGFSYRNKSLIRYRLWQVEELLDGTFLHQLMTLIPVFTDLNPFSVSHWRKGVYPWTRTGLAQEPNHRSEQILPIKLTGALRAEAVAYNLLLRVILDGIPDK
jgi:hypothetical protein